jgi:CheY-like chemotaxis protein
MVHILVIEDNTEIRENITELLELEGFKVTEAINGKEGLEMAIERSPHLILCDIMMPQLSGYEVLKELRERVAGFKIPFIFLSANVEKKDVRAGLDMGACAYIKKPFEPDDLISEVRRSLDNQT